MFRARLNLIRNSSSHTGLSMRGYIIQRDTPIWTSPSRTRWAVGRLTRSHSSRRGSSLHLLLLLELHLHRQLRRLRNLHQHLQLRLELEAKRSQRGASDRGSATATSGRANPDKSGTTSPSFRGERTIRFL